jgi:hypothetical protein
MNYGVTMPRKTYNDICAALQKWSAIYALPGAVVMRGSLRGSSGGIADGVIDSGIWGGGADMLAQHYQLALRALGRAKVALNLVLLDLRDLSDDELDSILLVTQCIRLQPGQAQVLDRLSALIHDFVELPAMVRVALSAGD